MHAAWLVSAMQVALELGECELAPTYIDDINGSRPLFAHAPNHVTCEDNA